MLQVKAFQALSNSELYDVLKLRQDVFILEQTCLYPDMDDLDQSAEHVLLYSDQTLLGCCRILSTGDDDLIVLGRIVVSADARGQGYAGKLLKFSMAYITENKSAKSIKISAQTRLIQFYQSLGFEITSQPYDEDGIEHIEMKATVIKSSIATL